MVSPILSFTATRWARKSLKRMELYVEPLERHTWVTGVMGPLQMELWGPYKWSYGVRNPY